MEILAILIGYTLGVLPFVVPKIVTLLNSIENNTIKAEDSTINLTSDLINEWVNGEQKKDTLKQQRPITPKQVYEEYISGEET